MKIKLLSKQWEVMQSTAPNIAYIGGVGSGKTHLGSVWILNKCNEESQDLITANTYGQLHKATLHSVFKNFEQWGINYTYNKQSGELIVDKRKRFLCMSIDAYDNNRGIEVGNWWGDEAAYYPEDAYNVMSGRKRDKRGSLQTLLTTTPKGYNWMYDRFHPSGEKYNPKLFHMINCRTQDNHHLPQEYIDALMSQFDDKLISQELMGEFVNLTQGKVYYEFTRESCVIDALPSYVNDLPINDLPIYVSFDFNVAPGTAIVWRVSENEMIAIDEVFIMDNSDTFIVSEKLIEKGYRGANVVADSTGANRSTKGKSDHHILRDYGFKVIPFTNPPVIDRVNNMNLKFKRKNIKILSKLVKTINDFEKVTWKGDKLDQSTDKTLTHLSDGAGYLAWKLWPLRGEIKRTTTIQL